MFKYSPQRVATLYLLLGSFLFVSDCFLLTLTSTGVVLGALTTQRKTETVTDAAIAANVHQSFDVHLNFGTEGTFDFVLIVDDGAEGVLFIIGPVLHFLVLVDAGFCQNLGSKASTNTEDIGETYNSINSFYSFC